MPFQKWEYRHSGVNKFQNQKAFPEPNLFAAIIWQDDKNKF